MLKSSEIVLVPIPYIFLRNALYVNIYNQCIAMSLCFHWFQKRCQSSLYDVIANSHKIGKKIKLTVLADCPIRQPSKKLPCCKYEIQNNSTTHNYKSNNSVFFPFFFSVLRVKFIKLLKSLDISIQWQYVLFYFIFLFFWIK